jgi:outer membrane protein insertion porin family
VAVLFLCLPSAVRAQFEGDIVDRIEIEGLVSWTPQQITDRLKTKTGRPFRPLDAREDLQALSRIMRTANYSLEPTAAGKVVVRFRVTEFPRLRELQVIGNEKVETDRIERLLEMTPGETVLNAQVVESAQRALEREYRERGLGDAGITINLIDVEEPGAGLTESETAQRSQADLQVMIEEGERIVCDDMIVRGNKAFSTARLKLMIQTDGSWLFLKNYYSDAQFEEDLNRLRDFYAANGYFDARIRRGAFEMTQRTGKSVVSPVVEIEEGERYRLGEVTARGARLYSLPEVLEPFERLKGKPFDGQTFGIALEKVRGLYLNHGLLTTEIRPEYSYDAEQHNLNVLLQIVERERIYVGRVQLVRPVYNDSDDEQSWFRGFYLRMAPPVRDEVVMREMLLEPGAIYNRRLERDSLRRLARLGVFDNQKLKIEGAPTADPGVQDVLIEADEAVSGVISGEIGFGDVQGAHIGAQLVERNVGGNADTFSLGVSLGTRSSAASVRYFNRHLGDSRDSLDSRLFYEIQSRTGYRANIGGTHVEWSHPLRGEWVSYLRGRLEVVTLEERGDIEPDEDLDRVYPVATLRLRLAEDTREPFGALPREGYLQSIGLEAGYAGGPLVNIEAWRDQYLPLTDRLTWRYYAMAGIIPYHRDTLPIHERYFLGGNNDLRGFAYRGAGYFDSGEEDIPIGGSVKLLLKNELIFPLFRPVSGVLFADVGALGESPQAWQAPRASTGVGLRFDMQRAQVGLDLAVPIAKRDGDDTRFFHFSLQSQF